MHADAHSIQTTVKSMGAHAPLQAANAKTALESRRTIRRGERYWWRLCELGRDANQWLGDDLADLGARLATRRERGDDLAGTIARDGEEEAARRLRFREQTNESRRERRLDAEPRAEHGIEGAAIPFHPAAENAALGELARPAIGRAH